MTTLPYTNATVDIWRGAYNASTKQTSVPVKTTSAPVPIYIADVQGALAVEQGLPDYDLLFLIDGAVDVRDGDQLRGYDPNGSGANPILVVVHVDPTSPPPANVKSGRLKALPQPGGST